jgi:hypothetical protein
MKITARGATDAANIVLFWPENLPDEGDAMLASDPIALVESLRDQGKLIWFLCDGDGEYTVAIFVRSLVPEDLMVHCRDEERIPVLAVRGVGYFGGMEYMFKQYPKLLTKYPAMCEQVLTPEGTYAARVYRTEVPESLYESWLAAQAGVGAKRLWDIHGVIAAGAVASVFAMFLAFFFVPWTVWFCILAIASALVVCAVAISHTNWYKLVARARVALEKSYPSYVVHLE